MVRLRAPRNQLKRGASSTYRQQSDLIVQCARKCIEEKGVKKTTLVDIAREADMTRELIYYYFSGKQEIVEQLLASYIQDAVETARLWCDTWKDATLDERTPLSRDALVDAIAAIRRFVFYATGDRRSMFAVLNEIGRRQEVFSRMCSAIMNELESHQTAKRLAATFDQYEAYQAKSAFMLYLLGIIGLIECSRCSDEEVASLLYADADLLA